MCDYLEENAEEGFEVSPSADGGDQAAGTVEEQLENLNEKEYRARRRRHRSFWKRPPTYVYPDNFGFGVNSYQSMIDYLDAKDHGGVVKKEEVHLPLLEERCMRRYASYNPFRWYQNSDIDRYIAKGEKIRTQIRQNDAVGVSNVLRRTHTNWSMTRKWVQLVKDSLSSKYRQEHKGFELPETPRRRPSSPVRIVDLRESTPTRIGLTSPVNKSLLHDQLQAEFNSVISSLAQSRMEYDSEMEKRQQRLQLLDEKFEDTINRMYEQVQRISDKADRFASASKDPREIEVDTENITLRNRIRRQEEMRNLVECVDDLTEMNSARNQLRHSLRNLDNETLALSDRVDDMTQQHAHQQDEELDLDLTKMDFADVQDYEKSFDYDHLMAMANSRKKQSLANKLKKRAEDDDEIEEVKSCRKPKHALLWAQHDRVTTRPKQPLMRDEVMSDTLANILNKASELATGTSESRRINSRARYINVFKPRPDTADRELLVPPSRTELNIDFMAKTLAQKGKCHRRYDIDQEVDNPKSGLNTNARKNYCEMGIIKRREEFPSLSNRVRYANIRSRARITLLGY